MSDLQQSAVPSGLPFAERVILVGSDEPFRWLAADWRDFAAARVTSVAYGMLFVVAGFALSYGLIVLGLTYLIGPLTVGFMLVGPALTVGFYAISRDLESGRRPSFSRAFTAWRANPAQLISLGLLQVVFLVVWVRFAAVIFAICFPPTTLDTQALLNTALFTTDGNTFLLVGTIVGAGMSCLAFTFGAFSLPLLLDRRAGALAAVVTSAVAVILNIRAMAVWAGIVVVLGAAGLAAGYVGLAITLPLLGHATWHAYRGVIRA